MTRFAIDAATLLDLMLDGRAMPPRHQLVAPNSIRSRALDLLLAAVDRQELSEQRALELHERLTMQKMRLLGDRVSRRVAWNIAREACLESVRDAEYVAVARLQADALIAGDPAVVALAADTVQRAPFDALFH